MADDVLDIGRAGEAEAEALRRGVCAAGTQDLEPHPDASPGWQVFILSLCFSI